MKILENVWEVIRYPHFFILSQDENSDNLPTCFTIFGALICGAPFFTAQNRYLVFALCAFTAALFAIVKYRRKIFSFDGLMSGLVMMFFLWLFAQVVWAYLILLVGFLTAALQILRELFALWLNKLESVRREKSSK